MAQIVPAGFGSVWVWFCSSPVNCVADSKAESIGGESPNSPIAAFPTHEPWPSLIFVIDARGNVFREAIINRGAGGKGKITAIPEPGSDIQMCLAEKELAGKEQVFVTKEPHARTTP